MAKKGENFEFQGGGVPNFDHPALYQTQAFQKALTFQNRTILSGPKLGGTFLSGHSCRESLSQSVTESVSHLERA